MASAVGSRPTRPQRRIELGQPSWGADLIEAGGDFVTGQEPGGRTERTTGAQRLFAVERIGDFNSEAGAIADVFDDLMAEVSDAKDDPDQSATRKQAQLMIYEWLAGDRHERLGELRRDRAKSSGTTAGQNGHRDRGPRH